MRRNRIQGEEIRSQGESFRFKERNEAKRPI